MWIGICRHCSSPAFTFKRRRRPMAGEIITPDMICWANGESAVRTQNLFGTAIAENPRCMSCGRVNSQPSKMKWVKPKDIYCGSESAIRSRYKILLRAAVRICAFINRVAGDDRIPDDVRDAGKDLNRIIFMLRESSSLRDAKNQEAVTT